MFNSSLKLIAVFHAMQHVILSFEAGEVSAEQADRDMADIAKKVPALNCEWRADLYR